MSVEVSPAASEPAPADRPTQLAVGADSGPARLSADEARSLTDEVKLDAERLWAKLVELYEGEAHLALGYSSWGDYFTTEFGKDRVYGYRLLEAGRVMAQLPIGNSRPVTESQARELAPLLDQPELLRGAWAEVVELHPEPTAKDVREVVSRKMDVHYSSTTDLWATPQALFDELHREFAFTLDVCATPGNAKCGSYFTEATDGLGQEWRGVCWMNPPYGDEIVKWVRKAYEWIFALGDPPHAFIGISADRLKCLAARAEDDGRILRQPYGSCPTAGVGVSLRDLIEVACG